MSFKDKFRSAQQELYESGIWKSNSNPPFFSLLRKIGVNNRPGHYRNFISNFFITFFLFGLFWGVPMWFVIWQYQEVSFQIIVGKIIFVSTVVSLYMAVYYKLSSRRNNLSKWEQL